MMRGQTLLVLAFLIVMIVVAISVYALKTFASMSGGPVFFLTSIIAIVAFLLFAFVVTKMGL